MSVTLAQLYQYTGAKLGIVRADESLSAEDAALIAAKYATLHEQLLSEGLTTWSATEAIPSWAESIMVEMLAALLVDEFGTADPRRSILRIEGLLGLSPVSPAERKLRRQLALPYTPSATHVEYF